MFHCLIKWPFLSDPLILLSTIFVGVCIIVREKREFWISIVCSFSCQLSFESSYEWNDMEIYQGEWLEKRIRVRKCWPA